MELINDLKIASVQMPNTRNIETNFETILTEINSSIEKQCDLIVFPECSLSGFTAEMTKCSMDFLTPYFNKIKEISYLNNITVILPSSYFADNHIYNAVFVFQLNKIITQYKIGLTESERQFFSIPEVLNSKIITTKGIRIAILVCVEAQMAPFSFIKDGDFDLIIWPGYISSGQKKEWNNLEKNEVFENMKMWKVPLIQSNYSFNDSSIGKDRGPDGHSVVINKNNKLIKRGKYKENDILFINFNDLL